MGNKIEDQSKVEIRFILKDGDEDGIFEKFKEACNQYFPIKHNEVAKRLLNKGLDWWIKNEKKEK